MPRATKGILVDCEPSIKAIVVRIDGENHDFIIEDLDDRCVVIKENKLAELKRRLAEVGCLPQPDTRAEANEIKILKSTQPDSDDSDSAA